VRDMGELTRPSTAIRLFFLVARPQGVAAQPLVLKALEKEFPSRCNHILQRTPSQSFLINLLVRPRAFIVGAVARDIKPREISVPHQEALGCQSTSIRNQRSAVHQFITRHAKKILLIDVPDRSAAYVEKIVGAVLEP
jgi:hypothetical protein